MANAADKALASGRRMRMALFDYGFRPFFLLAPLHAVLVLAAWLGFLHGLLPENGGWPALRWHGHEMLFGFTSAAIAGFLLTAVPNWTGRRGYAGTPLVMLAALWVAGRIAVNPAVAAPAWLAAALDLAFFPALIGVILPSLVRAKNRRNYVFAGVLLVFTAASGLHHLEAAGLARDTWAIGTRLGLDMLLVLVAVVGGRIIPSFTANALKRQGGSAAIVAWPLLDRLAIGALAAAVVVDLLLPETPWAGAVALAAAVLHALRLAQWQGLRTRRMPILWILHAAYAWIPIGLALKAAWLIGGSSWAANWMHALTIGAIATMILAVMSRVALGHTGRGLVAPRAIVGAYVALMAGAVLRVFGPVAFPSLTLDLIAAAGCLWILAFGAFVVVYTPILATARPDGRAG